MPLRQSSVVGSALLGAALAMPAVEAFATPGSASQHSAPATLRGATQAVVPQTASQSSGGLPGVLSAAAGVATVGALAGAVARVGQRQKSATKVVRNFSKEQQLGAQPPLGFWDPLDLCKDEATFKDYRAKELKHGRAAMMGALGMLTQSLVQVPGMEGVPKGADAIFVGNGMVGGIAVLALIGGLEAFVFVQDESKEPGNFGNPLPWWSDYSDEMRSRELNNGRIAMFAAIGQIAASLYTGKSGLEQLGL